MKKTIDTKYLGKIDVAINEVIRFSVGLPGFSEENEFILLELPGNPTFQIMQSINTPTLAFILTNPYHFYQDYAFKLDEQTIEFLKVKDVKDVSVFTIVTLKSPFHSSTLNLQAPIIIHVAEKIGKQYILDQTSYQTKASIVPSNTSETRGDSLC